MKYYMIGVMIVILSVIFKKYKDLASMTKKKLSESFMLMTTIVHVNVYMYLKKVLIAVIVIAGYIVTIANFHAKSASIVIRASIAQLSNVRAANRKSPCKRGCPRKFKL